MCGTFNKRQRIQTRCQKGPQSQLQAVVASSEYTHSHNAVFFVLVPRLVVLPCVQQLSFRRRPHRFAVIPTAKLHAWQHTVVFGSGAIYGRIRIPGPGCCYSIAFRCAPIPPVAGVVDAFSVRIACAEIKRDITADLRCVHWHRRAACWATIYAVARAPARKRF